MNCELGLLEIKVGHNTEDAGMGLVVPNKERIQSKMSI